MAENVTITGVEVLKPGTYTDANGKVVALELSDLRELAAEYDPALLDAPAVVGHPKMDHPAYGWMRDLRVEGEILLCDLVDVDPEFAETLKARRFKNKSLSFYLPRSRGNPKPGKLYPKHLGLLGARAPAVPGLKPISFAAGDEAVVIELAGPSPWLFRSIATAFSSIRDFLIESQGTEKADAVIAPWLVNDLRDAAAEMEAARDTQPIPAFATPEQGGPMATAEELAARAAELDAREADIATRQQRVQDQEVSLAAAEATARKKDDEAFVAGLIEAGKLAPGEKDNVLAELAALDDGATIDLAAGDDGQPVKLTPRQAYRRRLDLAPVMIQRGPHQAGGDPLDAAVDFAAPDGCVVDQAGLDLHRRAQALIAANPGMDYLAAVKAASK